MPRSSTRRLIKRLSDLPTAQGGLSRLAADRLRTAGIKIEPLLSRVGLTIDQINDPERRISASNQIAFLQAAAEALNDDLLGFTLAQEFDLRDLGLLYYVMASSDTLGDASKRVARYSRITNEAIVLQYHEAREPTLRLVYSGIPRHTDLQQIEFCIVAIIRLSRVLSDRWFLPRHISISHIRPKGIAKFSSLLGKSLEFGGSADEINFPIGSADWALVDADQRLNKILRKLCEDSLSSRGSNTSTLRAQVENTISPLLPHGQAKLDVVARRIGMSARTLTRRLAEEGLTFNEILQQLKSSFAIRYLEEDSIPISKIAWLLGFEDASSFTPADGGLASHRGRCGFHPNLILDRSGLGLTDLRSEGREAIVVYCSAQKANCTAGAATSTAAGDADPGEPSDEARAAGQRRGGPVWSQIVQVLASSRCLFVLQRLATP
jgi:AraC-like DNA-binding protein